MKLKYKSADKDYNESFYLKREQKPYYDGNWHYHEEYELIYILKGEGVRIVGDNLSNFRPIQLVLVGPWLPHLWKNVESDTRDETVDIIVIKFTSLIGGQGIFLIPEFGLISDLLNQSQRGLTFSMETIHRVHVLLLAMTTSDGPNKIINLLQVLKILSESKDTKTLTSNEFTLPTSFSNKTRLKKIINYISDNFTEQISLEELAREASMTPSSLCRFFKNRTNKTIFQFINEFRIGKACQMLISGTMSIKEICFKSGFNSLTSFNRIFKEYKRITPKEYNLKYRVLNQ